jgi:hypothetical protein
MSSPRHTKQRAQKATHPSSNSQRKKPALSQKQKSRIMGNNRPRFQHTNTVTNALVSESHRQVMSAQAASQQVKDGKMNAEAYMFNWYNNQPPRVWNVPTSEAQNKILDQNWKRWRLLDPEPTKKRSFFMGNREITNTAQQLKTGSSPAAPAPPSKVKPRMHPRGRGSAKTAPKTAKAKKTAAKKTAAKKTAAKKTATKKTTAKTAKKTAAKKTTTKTAKKTAKKTATKKTTTKTAKKTATTKTAKKTATKKTATKKTAAKKTATKKTAANKTAKAKAKKTATSKLAKTAKKGKK